MVTSLIPRLAHDLGCQGVTMEALSYKVVLYEERLLPPPLWGCLSPLSCHFVPGSNPLAIFTSRLLAATERVVLLENQLAVARRKILWLESQVEETSNVETVSTNCFNVCIITPTCI